MSSTRTRLFVATTTFIILFVVTAAVLAWLIPTLTQWHFAHCMSDRSTTCDLSSAFLKSWWWTVIPLLLGVSAAVGHLSRRRVT